MRNANHGFDRCLDLERIVKDTKGTLDDVRVYRRVAQLTQLGAIVVKVAVVSVSREHMRRSGCEVSNDEGQRLRGDRAGITSGEFRFLFIMRRIISSSHFIHFFF